MNRVEKNSENILSIKDEILSVFQNVSDFLKAANFTEALPTIGSHFRQHLDQAFIVNKRDSSAAPVYFVDSIISEYFLFRPFPDDPSKSSFIEPENSRFLRLTALLIIDQLHPKFDFSSSQFLTDPQFMEGFRQTRSWYESVKSK